MARNKAKYTESEILAKLAAQGMVDKKGLEVRIMDLSELVSAPANFFVVCSGNVPSHTQAISDGVFETIKKATGYNPHRVEGYNNAEWILMDYFDVIVHIFLKDKREHYRLEELWADAKVTEVASEPEAPAAPKPAAKKPVRKSSKPKAKPREPELE